MARLSDRLVNDVWYGRSAAWRFLAPLAWLYAGLSALRRLLYRAGILNAHDVGAPVIVVGNISVGGTGKTPLAAWLAAELSRRGWSPGIVSRGYGGRAGRSPVTVTAEADPDVVGDEAILLARRSGCPVMVHPRRVAAARALSRSGVDVVIADDGLQHYRMTRHFEIAVVDDARRFGNGRLLPAGPLREAVGRLADVDAIALQVGADPTENLPAIDGHRPLFRFRLQTATFVRLGDGARCAPADFAERRIHALAGIGNPERFFLALRSLGFDVDARPLPDHAPIEPADISFGDDLPVVMTEKDAVKCARLDTGNCWYAEAEVEIEGAGADTLIRAIEWKIRQPGVGTQ